MERNSRGRVDWGHYFLAAILLGAMITLLSLTAAAALTEPRLNQETSALDYMEYIDKTGQNHNAGYEIFDISGQKNDLRGIRTEPAVLTDSLPDTDISGAGIRPNLCITALCLLCIAALTLTNLRKRRRLTAELQALQSQRDAMQQTLRDAFRAAADMGQAKSDFLSRMSHDMRTPLTAVLGMTAVALAHLDDRRRVRDCLEKIDTSGRQLLTLINDTLDMSKIESGGMVLDETRFDLTDELGKILSEARKAAGKKNIRLDAAADFDHPAVLGDARRLGQALRSLLDNAVKYTPAGGTVTFRARERASPTTKSGYFEFTVEDTGTGIAPDLLPKIFEPFVRGESENSGAGLGLSIAQTVVKLMGGEIKAESEPGRGSKFTVYLYLKLPKRRPDLPLKSARPAVPDGAPKSITRHAGIRVLLVEDIEINRIIAGEMLRKAGLLVETAQNGAEAAELTRKNPPSYYDLIFMDLQMPIMDGYQAARAIRASDREDLRQVPIVAVSANAFQEDVLRAKEAGMNDLVMKPADLSRLLAALDQWLPKGDGGSVPE